MLRKPLFLDRDGVLNHSAKPHEYVTRREEFVFLPETFPTMRKLQEAGYDFYIITNQAGVARGQTTLEAMNTLHEWVKGQLKEEGIEIKGIYMCPHHDADNCECRKPKPGLLLRAIEEHDLDPADVVFVGDRPTDAQAGAAAGVRTIIIPVEVGLRAALPQLL